MEKAQNMQGQMGNISRYGNSKVESKGSTRHQKSCRMPLMGSLADWAQLKKKISELQDISLETSKTEKPRKNRK